MAMVQMGNAGLFQKFYSLFPRLKQELMDELVACELPSEAIQWISEMTEYNLKGGKMNRGICVVETMQVLRGGGEELSEEDFCNAAVLGWCIEWMQAFFLVADDIMDGSQMRRGQCCWYRKERVGMIAINDSFLLQSGVFRLLKRYFADLPIYIKLVDLFLEIIYKTELGQLFDLITAHTDQSVDFVNFTPERHSAICRNKTAYYSFNLPVLSALIASGNAKESVIPLLEQTLLSLGEFFQIQDDYLDCYGAVEEIGKVGTDIIDGKCSWLVVQALHHPQLTEEMHGQLKLHYGRKDPSSEAIIKELYEQLHLSEIFQQQEQCFKTDFDQNLITLRKEDPHLAEAVSILANKIFHRKK